MGDVWVRDTPFGPVTNKLRIAEKFEIELGIQLKFELNKNIVENKYSGGAKGKERQNLKYDITEFGLALLLFYINTPKARLISAEILYRFFILKTYLLDMSVKGKFLKFTI